MTVPRWVYSRRLSISALFGAILFLSVVVEYQLLKSSETILPKPLTKHNHGVDRSFFLEEHHRVERQVQKELKWKDEKNKDRDVQRVMKHWQETKAEDAEPKKAPSKLGEDKAPKAPSPKFAKDLKASQNISTKYLEDPLCGGCRSLKMPNLLRGIHQERCGILIYKVAQENNLSILHATRRVVHMMNHTDCLPCLICDPKQRQYWRYDTAAPPILNAKTIYLQSLPEDQYRIPTSVLTNPKTNLTEFFSKLNQQEAPPKPYLFEYNPSIVPLPEYMKFDSLEDGDQVTYIASFRVATTQACFNTETTLQLIGGEWESEKRPQKKDYLGLALLRQDLTVVAEAIVDLPRPFRKREDFRLFVLHGQLYVATYCKITPLWIVHKSEAKIFETRLQFDPTKTVHSWDCLQPFDSPLRVKIGSDITQCAEEVNDNKHTKNLNYFVQDEQTMVELFPLEPHTVRHLPHVKDPEAATPTRADDITTTELPPPSFYTLEEPILANELDFFEPPFTQDRGGACCIEIQHPISGKPLWLGIAHAKTPHARRKLKDRLASNQYLSRWYAFEPTAPYPIVAVSGFFCLPTPQASSENHNPLVALPSSKAWTLGSLAMACPVIHFVTGMTEKVGDAETLILAYGVADCTSWFAEVSRADVIQMLFFGPEKRAVTETKRNQR